MPAITTPDDLTVSATPDYLMELEGSLARLNRLAQRRMRGYFNDPLAFVHDCFDWHDDEGPTEYQEDIIGHIPEKKKVCVRSLHGAGKTGTAAMLILWFALTRDAAAAAGEIRDWKCPTTAGAWRQLEQYLWPEIHKWARILKWQELGRDPFKRGELLRLNLNLMYGSAFAVASDVPALIEGVHADQVFYLYDEAKAIIPGTFDASEGAFAGAGTKPSIDAYALASSTPGEPQGRFYEIQSQKPGYDDWHPIHVSLDRAVKAGRVSPDWAEKRKLQWGENSALYQNRVLGEFYASDEDSVIPLAWIEAAVERWYARKLDEKPLGRLTKVGVDVARFGDDKSAFALRFGNRVEEVRTFFHKDTHEVATLVRPILQVHNESVAVVDTSGLGSGTYDTLAHWDDTKGQIEAFDGGEGTEKKDKSGELGFRNKRSAAWWQLREMLEPLPELGPHGQPVYADDAPELPDDPILTGDLNAPHWKTVDGANGSVIAVEKKEDFKKRLGRSPDAGDAVVQAFWTDRKRKKRQITFAGGYETERKYPEVA